jgi:pyruvate,water dikinase
VALLLTDGSARGRAWTLNDPSMVLPEGFEPDTTILVARLVDAGWIPTFGLVAGVIVETGGDLSHGSIILREIGLPAITNAQRATATFQSGDEVWLRAGSGAAERVDVP